MIDFLMVAVPFVVFMVMIVAASQRDRRRIDRSKLLGDLIAESLSYESLSTGEILRRMNEKAKAAGEEPFEYLEVEQALYSIPEAIPSVSAPMWGKTWSKRESVREESISFT